MYGLLGEKLGHSFSPQIHANLGDYVYKLFEVESSCLEQFFKERNWDGINVTVPYKKTVLPYLDTISSSAQKIGCVNTIVKESNGTLSGYNTDYDGFLFLLKRANANIANKKCLILGTGGASLTVRAVLEDLGAKSVTRISRQGEDNYQNLEKHYDADIIVNTTPVGMYPNNGNAPLSLTKFKNLSGVFDIVYNPLKTALLLEAEALNIPCANGLSMLVAQAKRASELFFEKKIPDSKIEEIILQMENMFQNIILVGMPGCGKSTVGKILADKLGKEFLDSDTEIELSARKSIPQIFEESGEKVFRALEHEKIVELGKRTGIVLATGGGVIVTPENKSPLLQNGKVVFLERPLEELSRDGRPLSQHADLSEMYCKRLPLYRDICNLQVSVSGTPQAVADKIIKELEL